MDKEQNSLCKGSIYRTSIGTSLLLLTEHGFKTSEEIGDTSKTKTNLVVCILYCTYFFQTL